MTVQEQSAYDAAIDCGACHDDAMDAAECAKQSSNYWSHRGVRIIWTRSFCNDTMVYQWTTRRNTLKQVVVMQHETLIQTIQAISEHLDSTNVCLPYQS